MVQLQVNNFCKKVPVLKDADLEKYAIEIIKDYNPKCLKGVVPIDYFHFLECYLRVNVQFQHIYTPTKEEIIYGATSFSNNQKLKIFDEEYLRTDFVPIGRGDIILDKQLDCDSMLRKQKFTGFHEGAHWLLHQNYYYVDENQYSMFDMLTNSVGYCSKENIEKSVKSKLETPKDFMEHQANYLAAALMMPKPVFISEAKHLIRINGESNGYILIKNEHESENLLRGIVGSLAEMFDVSKQAATIRMKKLRLIIGDEPSEATLF